LFGLTANKIAQIFGHEPAGFRLWWRRLTGSDTTLDDHLMRLAGRFSRRVARMPRLDRFP